MSRTFIFVLSAIILAFTIILFIPSAASAEGSVGDVGVTFDTTEITQGGSTFVEIDYKNVGDKKIEVNLVGIHFDWQDDGEYYASVYNNSITLLPGEVDMNTIPMDVPVGAPPGDHEFYVVIRFFTDVEGIGYSEVEWTSVKYTEFTVLEKDTDGDSVVDSEDAFPQDPKETKDTDGDGVGDNADDFPNDANETTDTDKDGVGDNADVYPDDPDKWKEAKDEGDRSSVYVLIAIIVMLGIITIVAVIVIYRLRKKDEGEHRWQIVEARRSEQMMKDIRKRDLRKRRRERRARISASSTDWKMCSCGARVADGEQLCEYCGKKVS